VTNLGRHFGEGADRVVALDDVNFEIEGSPFVSIVGPSGCGKSTLLNILSGVLAPTEGKVEVTSDGREARVGYVFQNARLLPWRSVLDNLVIAQQDNTLQDVERCREYLRMVHLGDRMDVWPNQLSGGMQQRVGIARAFSVEPDVLIMDEPFSHLDAITARSLRRELETLWKQTGKTVLFVTHDVGEAIELSQRIIILAPGGKMVDDISIDLPYPREPTSDEVALAKADIMRRFEELDLLSS
jgi:NitT/TauT family transport system ATP-binding protein